MAKKFKEIKDSKLIIKKLVSKQVDQLGFIRNQYVEEEAIAPVSLGSYKDPNPNIVSFKWVIPSRHGKE